MEQKFNEKTLELQALEMKVLEKVKNISKNEVNGVRKLALASTAIGSIGIIAAGVVYFLLAMA